MRILIVGGTKFIGRAIVAVLHGEGHDVAVLHRGQSEPDDLPDVEHIHADRQVLAPAQDQLRAFDAEAVVDVSVRDADDAIGLLDALGDTSAALLAISSCDVYRAFAGLHAGEPTDAVPLDETAPVRPDGGNAGVEAVYGARGATILRLGAVYGEHDYQRRLEFILRRVRAGRRLIPIGTGTFLFSRVYVQDVAQGVRAVLDQGVQEQVLNLAEATTWPYRLFAQRILDATGHDAELVTVPDAVLPDDLAITGSLAQHLLVDSAKARATLGWVETPKEVALAQTVRWDLANPPQDDQGFGDDDSALEQG